MSGRDSTIFSILACGTLPTTKSFATENDDARTQLDTASIVANPLHAAIVDLKYRSSPRLTFALALPCSLTPRPLLSPSSRRARRRASSARVRLSSFPVATSSCAPRARARGGSGGLGHGAWAARRGGTNSWCNKKPTQQ